MRRILTVVALLLALVAGSIPGVFAQAAPATVYGSDGQTAGEIVVEISDAPFEGYASSNPPQSGRHYVMATVTITGTDGEVEAYPTSFYAVDTNGFIYTTTNVTRDAADPADFMGGSAAAGDSLSGVVFFNVQDGAELAYVYYLPPTGDRMATMADLREAPVAQGDTAAVNATDGSPVVTMTVQGVYSPLQDFDGMNEPRQDHEYLAVDVTIENVGESDYVLDPAKFTAVDDKGAVYAELWVDRPGQSAFPGLTGGDALAAGDTITGLVYFEVPVGTIPSIIYFTSGYGAQVRIAEYSADQAPEPFTPIVAGGAAPKPTTAATEGCDGVTAWITASLPNIELISKATALSGEEGEFDSDALMALSGELSDASLVQSELETPDVAASANLALVKKLEDASTAVFNLASYVDAQDDAGIAEAKDALMAIAVDDVTGSFINTYADLTNECPEVSDIY